MRMRRWFGGLLAITVGALAGWPAVTHGATRKAKASKATIAKATDSTSFSLSVPASVSANPGGNARIAIAVTRRNATVAAITLKGSRLPADWTMGATANPFQDNTTAVVRVPIDTPLGNYKVSVAGASGKSLVRISTIVAVVAPPATTPTQPVITQPPIPVAVTTQPAPVPTTTTLAATADFNLLVSPGVQTVKPGQTATFTITVNRTGGFAATVDLVATGIPAGTTGFFTPNPVGDTSFLQLATSASTPLGSFDISIFGRNRTAKATLIVSNDAQVPGVAGAPTTTIFSSAGFVMNATPTQQAVGATGTASYLIGISGAPSPVSFTVNTLPAGATFALGAAPTISDTTLTITTNGVAPGTYPFTLQGVAGTVVRTVGLTLVVGSVGSGFGLKASNDVVTVSRGGAGSLGISIVANTGFSLPVNLTLGSLPAGVIASLNPTTSTSGSLLNVAAQPSAFIGTNVLTITGTSAGLVASIQVTIVVT